MKYHLIKSNDNCEYSYILPISRDWMLPRLENNIRQITFPANGEWIIYLDTDQPEFEQKVRDMVGKLEHKFGQIKLIISEDKPFPNMGRVFDRRERIKKIHTNIKKYVCEDSQLILGQEDDTIVPANAFMKLVSHIHKNPGIGYAEGVEMSRWVRPIFGAWHIEIDENKEVVEVDTLPYRESGIQEIQGGGFYCFVCHASGYRQFDFGYGGECEGADVLFVLDFYRRGYRPIVDWDIKCEHWIESKREKMIYPSENYEVMKWRNYNGIIKRIS